MHVHGDVLLRHRILGAFVMSLDILAAKDHLSDVSLVINNK